MREARRRQPGASPFLAHANLSRRRIPKGKALLLCGALLLWAPACTETWEGASTDAPLPGEGSLRIGVRALESVAEVEVTLIPTKAPALPPVTLEAPPGGGAFSETVNGIRQGHYTVKARAFDAAQQQRFREASAPVVVLAGVQNNVDLFFVEERQDDEQAPHFVSIAYNGQPAKSSNFRFQVSGGGGEGALSLSGSGPGGFSAAGTDPRAGSHVDWSVPAQEGPATVTLTLEDEAGRTAHTRIELEVVGLSCDPGEVACDGVCVDDTDTNPLRCGPSCKDCGEGTCDQGICRPDPELANWPIAPDLLPDEQFEYAGPNDEYVLDTKTGLMWHKISSSGGNVNAANRGNACVSLNSTSIYDDWRVPTRMELLSIVNVESGGANPLPPKFQNTALFWTSTVPAVGDSRWVVTFSGPNQRTGSAYESTASANTRCVRFGPGYRESDTTPRYIEDPSGETFLDTYTGLRWQKEALAQPLSHADALIACQTESFEGTPGRLPTKRELESIVDIRRDPPFVPPVVHDADAVYWTSSDATGHSREHSETNCGAEGGMAYVVTSRALGANKEQPGETQRWCKVKGGDDVLLRARCVWDP